jgi:hypothetical protein
MQPAIKGLQPLSFMDNGKFLTYNEEVNMAANEELEGLKKELGFFQRIFSKFKIDVEKEKKEFAESATTETITATTNVVAAAATVENGKEAVAVTTSAEAVAKAAADQDKEKVVPAVVKTDVAEVRNEANEEANENEKLALLVKELQSKVATLETALENKKVEAVAEDNRAFCERLVREGKLRPADVDQEIENLTNRATIDNSGVQFSEGRPSVDRYKEHLAGRPKIVEFAEVLPAKDALVAIPKIDGDGVDEYIDSKIKDKMKLSPNISYMDAMKDCMGECEKEMPEQYKEYMKKFTSHS